ncbi:hypothetical protein [Nitrospira moscoviensis]|uniref:AlgX/AlgJ SGNH hydrolase-like domain-containing protein n=1 Tax=Nitrospira moscoviensis TaxID=42253 RepID=A0A0K2GIJ4_NITMO|nr:hypothetical protein [Nitrospira moscoviensis]ALA60770.1 conserved exported protein of unknown function [Nitrospira moscoviensis]
MRQRSLLSVLVMAGAGAVTLLLAEAALWLFPVSTSTGAMALDDRNPVMRYTPNQVYVFSKGWNFEMVNRGRINNYGFVNEQDYTKHGEADGPIVVIGDSYVEALMVPYEETVQGRLSRLLGPRRLVYSIGTSGSQLADYLAYAQFAGSEFHPCAMVFVIVGNDFDESLVQYSRGVGYHFERVAGESRFRMVRTDYHPSGWKQLMRHSALVRYLWKTVGVGGLSLASASSAEYVGNTDASASHERVAASQAAVDYFLRELPHRAHLPASRIVFVVDAPRPDLYSASGAREEGRSYFHLMRRYFLAAAAGLGYETIDMHPRFKARHQSDGTRFEFPIDGHWNGRGHEEAAKAVAASRTFQRLGM